MCIFAMLACWKMAGVHLKYCLLDKNAFQCDLVTVDQHDCMRIILGHCRHTGPVMMCHVQLQERLAIREQQQMLSLHQQPCAGMINNFQWLAHCISWKSFDSKPLALLLLDCLGKPGSSTSIKRLACCLALCCKCAVKLQHHTGT